MIDPVALQIGPLAIRWYGVSYAVALGLSMWILWKLNRKGKIFKTADQMYDLVFWVFLFGVILGGRLGYVLFYNLPYYLQNPIKVFAIWEGGMSFHGGLLASLLAGYLFCRKNKIDYLKLADLAVIPAALALFFTRIANFINGELYGRVILNPKWKWLGVRFGDGALRYPSQLFQAADSLVLFLVLLFIFSRKPKKGVLFFSYLALYGLFRVIIEFWRAPDPQVGFIFHFFTLGQILSAIMFLAGAIGLACRYRRS
ncbi:prolipoprotein diacylglyceryl transferase [Candidatus Peregrinibacteria bacterium]|nr:prolipoprotein diacylglyceryl transferase [Candidatus Peregrinibacteria bacterium]